MNLNTAHINPFLESSMIVLEQMCRVRPSIGRPSVTPIRFDQGPYWLKFNVVGDVEGEIFYSFPMPVALKLVSDMMGGYVITELDEIGQSAIAELGNMISGNASTILYNNGITIDITPPSIVEPTGERQASKAIIVPISLDGIGEVYIYVNFNSRQAS